MPDEVTVVPAAPADAPLLANLLELYLHDLSEAFPIDLGDDGRFGYPKLPLFWSEPDRRFPFLIRLAGRVVGFALVTRGSPMSDDSDVRDVAEFFILRRYRRTGAGRRAAFLLWDRFAGKWIVRVAESNPGALRFWSKVVAEYSGGAAAEVTRAAGPTVWRVFSFTQKSVTA